MKIRFAILAVAVLSITCAISAQEKQIQDPAQSKELNTQAYVQLLRADLKASKRTLIKEGMQLDETQAAAFWALREGQSMQEMWFAFLDEQPARVG